WPWESCPVGEVGLPNVRTLGGCKSPRSVEARRWFLPVALRLPVREVQRASSRGLSRNEALQNLALLQSHPPERVVRSAFPCIRGRQDTLSVGKATRVIRDFASISWRNCSKLRP